MAKIHNEMLKHFQQGHPAPWAIFDADEALLARVRDSEELSESFEHEVLTQIETDTDREARNLIDMYIRSSDEQRMIIDAVFVYLCGYSVPYLASSAAEPLSGKEVQDD